MKKKTFFTTQFMFLLFFNGAVLLLSVMLWKEKTGDTEGDGFVGTLYDPFLGNA